MADDEPEPAEEEECSEPEPEATEPEAKRKKPAPGMKKVNGLQSRLDAKVKKLETTEDLIAKMLHKQSNQALTKKEVSSLARWRSATAALVSDIASPRAELKEAQDEADEKMAARDAVATAVAEKKKLEAYR